MKELYKFRQFLTEGVIKEDKLVWTIEGEDDSPTIESSDKGYKEAVVSYIKSIHPNISDKDLEKSMEVAEETWYNEGRENAKSGEGEDFDVSVEEFADGAVEYYEDAYLEEGKLLKEELRDVEDILVKSGFRFDDGILGGVGSGGAGYYDSVNDNIYGYNQSGPWNEKEFNKFYDNFEFNSNLYDREDLEDLEISQPQLDKGIYAVEDMGYVEIRSNGDVEIYAIPQLADEDDSNFLPAFKMDASGRAIPQFSKDEMRKMLKDDMMYIL